MSDTATTRTAVEEAIRALAGKVINAADDSNGATAVQYSEALENACRGLSSVAEAQRDDRWEDE